MFSRNISKTPSLVLLALSLSVAISVFAATDSEAAPKRRGGGGARPSGGVFLQTPNPTTPVEHNNRGVELGSKGIWADAIREHEIAVEMDAYNTTWRTNLSAAHLEYGKHLRTKNKHLAASEFRKAMFVDPANAAADAELDQLLRSQGQDPMNLNFRQRLADDADVNAQYDTAIVEYRKCLKMSGSPKNRAALGRCLLKAGKPVDGFKELRSAVGDSNWANDERNELAACHRQLGDILKEFAMKAKDQGKGTKGMQRLANAAIEYRRAVMLNPSDGSAIQGLIEVAQHAVSIRPSFDNHLLLGGAYLLGGKFPQAQAEYKECFKLGPTRSELGAARIAYHQAVARSPIASDTQVAESVATIKKLIDDNAEDARLWYILGRLREHQVDYEKAKKCYDKAVSINPLIDPDLKAALVRLGASPAVASTTTPTKTPEQSKEALAKAMKEKEYADIEGLIDGGEHDKAIEKAQEMFSKDPKDGRTAFLIGHGYEKKGDADMAKGFYRTASALGYTNASRFVNQIDANRVQPKIDEGNKLKQDGKYLEAASSFRDALAISPERADVHRLLAECLLKIGDKKGAQDENAEADRLDRGDKPKVGDSGSESDNDGKKIGKKTAESKPAEEGMSAAALEMTTAKPKKK
ncbi:MAG: tetratricopeptide repeat protein [Candidatus Obscuribacterales bacterium]|jgi:tetratricopeptide (TPR) repeat protein|nr:tetratricopeptide repeat protein [Candidatus Obscuribacterales bacterium]